MKELSKVRNDIEKRISLIKRHASKAIDEIETAIKLANDISDYGTVVNLQRSLENLTKVKEVL